MFNICVPGGRACVCTGPSRTSSTAQCRAHSAQHKAASCSTDDEASAASTSQPSLPRRLVLGASLLSAAPALLPQSAEAASFFQFETPWSAFNLQPGVVGPPRKALKLNFAVLLMRATYDAVDALDFIAMDKFQIAFWKLRQAEFEPYKFMYDPIIVPVGELTSPVYFDFISFCQYAVVSRIIPDAPQVFKESCEDSDDDPLAMPVRTVRRDARFADNTKLPAQLQIACGDILYSSLRDGFRGEQFNAPAPMPASTPLPALATTAQQILDIFVENGFAIKARIIDVVPDAQGGGTWTMKVDAPANLWGLSTLQFRRALVNNAFDSAAVQSFLRESGFAGTFKTEVVDAVVFHSWDIKRL